MIIAAETEVSVAADNILELFHHRRRQEIEGINRAFGNDLEGFVEGNVFGVNLGVVSFPESLSKMELFGGKTYIGGFLRIFDSNDTTFKISGRAGIAFAVRCFFFDAITIMMTPASIPRMQKTMVIVNTARSMENAMTAPLDRYMKKHFLRRRFISSKDICSFIFTLF